MRRVMLTHSGWFGLCPVYIGDAKSEEPFLDPRHWSLEWLLWLSLWFFELAFMSCEQMGVEPPGFKVHSVERLKRPIWIEVE